MQNNITNLNSIDHILNIEYNIIMEHTLGIIKPDAAKHADAIIKMITDSGLQVIKHKTITMTTDQAQALYEPHKERSFYNQLCTFMISGPIVILEIAGNNAILKYRELMGATNPTDAKEGTIRHKFATNIDNNAVHGSDSAESAAHELAIFW